jgi:Trk-type K+ transport system membrane component
MGEAIIRLILFLVGFVIVAYTVLSAIRTFILPRSARDPISRAVFLTMRRLFDLRVRGAKSYNERDAIMALYAPISLMTLPPVWLICVLLGYMFMFRAVGVPTLRDAFLTSGSSVLTLGFASIDTVPKAILAFSAGTIG